MEWHDNLSPRDEMKTLYFLIGYLEAAAEENLNNTTKEFAKELLKKAEEQLEKNK